MTDTEKMREAFESSAILDPRRNHSDTGYYYRDVERAFMNFCDGYHAALSTRGESHTLAMEGALGALESAQQGYELLIDKYPHPDVNHVDYRVNAARISEDALSDIKVAIASLTKALGR